MHELRTYGRTPWILTFGTLLLGVGRGIAAPFMTIYLVETRHIPLAVVGLAITIEFLVRALVGPVAGALSDNCTVLADRGPAPWIAAGRRIRSIRRG